MRTIYLIRIDGQPRYVGETTQTIKARLGHHRRYTRALGRSTHWSRYLDAAIKAGAKVTTEAVATAPTKAKAKELEAMYAAMYRDRGFPIQNREFGGKYEPESKRAISAKTRVQDRVGGPGVGIIKSVPVVNVETGERFPSVSAAARSVNAPQSSVSIAIKGGWRCHGVRFEKVAA